MSKLTDAINNENISDIRNSLKANLTADPADMNNFIKSALRQVEQKNLPIWQEHDGATFNTNRSAWTEDYFVDLQVDLRMNFSKERFLHMLEVGKVAFPAPVVQPSAQVKSTSNGSRPQSTSQGSNGGKKNISLLLVGLAVVILIAIIVKLMKNS
jgi:hypothetical protein